MIDNIIDNRYLTIKEVASNGLNTHIIKNYNSDNVTIALMYADPDDLMDFIFEDVIPNSEDHIILDPCDDDEDEAIYHTLSIWLSTPEEEEHELIYEYTDKRDETDHEFIYFP